MPESEGGRISTLSSLPDSQIVHSDGGASLVASGETQVDGRKHDSNNSLSPPNCDKSAYSSMVGLCCLVKTDLYMRRYD